MVYINARAKTSLKKEADAFFESNGITESTNIKSFYKEVVNTYGV